MKKELCILSIIIAISILAVGCLDNDFEEQPTIFSLTLTIPDGDQWLVSDTGDSLRILNFTMLVDSIEVVKQGLDNDIFEPDPRLVSFSTLGLSEESSIGAGGLTGGRYEAVEFTVLQPDMDTSITDENLVTRDSAGNVTASYSFAVTGIIIMEGCEPEDFRFRSQVNRRVKYGFMEVVEMPETLGTLNVQLRGNWQNWFVDPVNTNQFLNPNSSANRNQIEQSIIDNFEIATFDVGGI